MTTVVAHLDDIQHRLDALARRHRIPGAALAIAKGDELLDFATGVLSVRTGAPVTTDAAFQIGSNTKLMTATLIMQLVDAGEVELDAPVRSYVPTFDLAESGAADVITLRQLLTHTSGIEGDHFQDYGRGDEATGRYVDSLAGLGLVHRPGAMWSYCNSGFVLAGYVVERVTGLPFHQALRERICEPLGLGSVTVLAEEMLAQPCAVGHQVGPDMAPAVPKTVIMAMAAAPAGSRTVATAADLVRFARMHLAGGVAASGTRLLSAASARAMREPQLGRPPTLDVPLAQGLGWLLSDWNGLSVAGHGGGTIGQRSFLEAIPERDLVIALLTNAPHGGALWRDLGRWLFQTLGDARMPRVPRPPDPAPELPLENYTGTYERLGHRYELTVSDGQLVMTSQLTGSVAELWPTQPPPVILRPVTPESFYVADDDLDALVTFHEFDQGRPGYLFCDLRMAPRMASRS
jgi:CubicO group peptidase (beta-lactamase class C family)